MSKGSPPPSPAQIKAKEEEAAKLSAANEARATHIANSLSFSIGYVTKSIKDVQTFLEKALSDGLPPEETTSLRSSISEARKRKEKLEETLQEYTGLTGRNIVETDATLIRLQTNFDKIIGAAEREVSKLEFIAKVRPRSDEALRPKPISIQSTAQEMEEWVRDLKSWFSASCFGALPPSTQRATAIKLLEGELALFVKANVADKSPVFKSEEANAGTKSLETWVRTMFLTTYPLCQRRLDLFRFKQDSTSERFSTYRSRFLRLLKTSDWDNLTRDQIKKYLFVSGICNEKLREKIVEKDNELENATIEDLYKVGETFELNASTLNTYNHPIVAPPIVAKAHRKQSSYQKAKKKAIKQVEKHLQVKSEKNEPKKQGHPKEKSKSHGAGQESENEESGNEESENEDDHTDDDDDQEASEGEDSSNEGQRFHKKGYRCYRCEKDHFGEPCKYRNKTCRKCLRIGHASEACKSPTEN